MLFKLLQIIGYQIDYNNNKDRKQLDDYNAQRLRAWKKHGHNLNRYNLGDCE